MYRQIDSDYAVAGQLRPEDMKALADAGFRSVVNNRPDGEELSQPNHSVMEAAARAAGLQYAYIPVGAAFPVEAAAVQLRSALPQLATPILGYCRSGARSTTVYQLARSMG
jgi:sulfide:quinone oxidoreductase